MSNYTEQDIIDSKTVLTKCHISRATLNNYIKLGLIPKPIIQKPCEKTMRTKKIGYFPLTVLDNIKQISTLKKEGYLMEDIARNLKVVSDAPRENKIEGEDANDINRPPIKTYINNKALQLTIDNITTPAYLVNNQFEIEWINEQAEEMIFHQQILTIQEAESRNIFGLFFKWMFQNDTKNWEEIIELHMRFLKLKHAKNCIANLYSGISEKEVDFLQAIYDKTEDISKDLITQTPVKIIKKDGTDLTYTLYATFFREGLFFVFEPAERLMEGITELLLNNRRNVINDLVEKKMPTLIPFCVLVADLQDSVRICAELPPEEYFQLINSIWKKTEDIFKGFYGIYGKHSGDGIVYYFLKEPNSNYIINAVNAAIEVKDKVENISAEWKIKKKWHNDLFLNIGINEGQEYFSSVHASTSIEFTALGETINYAARLSDIARYGSILVTKNLMNKMLEEDRKKIRYGIVRRFSDRDVFVENVFSRVMDFVSPESPKYAKSMDIAALPIAEITGRVR